MDYSVSYLIRAIEQGLAYTVDIDGKGTFVLMQGKQYNPRFPPIEHYAVTPEMKQSPDDFVGWIPQAGVSNEPSVVIESPWGSGRPSANLYVCCMYSR